MTKPVPDRQLIAIERWKSWMKSAFTLGANPVRRLVQHYAAQLEPSMASTSYVASESALLLAGAYFLHRGPEVPAADRGNEESRK